MALPYTPEMDERPCTCTDGELLGDDAEWPCERTATGPDGLCDFCRSGHRDL